MFQEPHFLGLHYKVTEPHFFSSGFMALARRAWAISPYDKLGP